MGTATIVRDLFAVILDPIVLVAVVLVAVAFLSGGVAQMLELIERRRAARWARMLPSRHHRRWRHSSQDRFLCPGFGSTTAFTARPLSMPMAKPPATSSGR